LRATQLPPTASLAAMAGLSHAARPTFHRSTVTATDESMQLERGPGAVLY